VVVLALCAAAITAVALHIRCVDAAREVARLAARGDTDAVHTVAPDGAAVQIRRDGEFVVVTVTARSAVLPGVTVAAKAVAAAEPGVG
jgi:hypothetical protein